MAEVTVEVTDQDVRQGSRNGVSCCPVRIALARALGDGFRAVSVRRNRMDEYVAGWVGEDRVLRSAPLPAEASEALLEYDRGGRLAPMSFTLEV